MSQKGKSEAGCIQTMAIQERHTTRTQSAMETAIQMKAHTDTTQKPYLLCQSAASMDKMPLQNTSEESSNIFQKLVS